MRVAATGASVVLPAPFGPSTTHRSPSATSQDTFDTIGAPPLTTSTSTNRRTSLTRRTLVTRDGVLGLGVPETRRAGALTAWGGAYLCGAVSLDVAAAATVGPDAVHRVVGAPGEDAPVPVSVALGRLRAQGVVALRLVLPEAGDPTGLPGPPGFTATAVAAGAAVVGVGPPKVPAYALVPTTARTDEVGEVGEVVRWDVVPVDFAVAPAGLPTLSEADRGLLEAMAASTDELAALDVARGRDELSSRLRMLDRSLRDIELPASLPARAQRLVSSASRLLGILDIAVETDGAAVTASETLRRSAALRPCARPRATRSVPPTPPRPRDRLDRVLGRLGSP